MRTYGHFRKKDMIGHTSTEVGASCAEGLGCSVTHGEEYMLCLGGGGGGQPKPGLFRSWNRGFSKCILSILGYV